MKIQYRYLLINLFTLSLLTLNLSSCGSDSETKTIRQTDTGDGQDQVNEETAGYSEASCLYKFNEGARALNYTGPDVKEIFFNKKLDLNLLNSVLGASAQESVTFAESTNVKYYKLGRYSTKSCLLLESLPDANSELRRKLESVSGGSGSILGIYFGLKTPQLTSTNNNAAILIQSDANKWVIVHEFVHHLFELQNQAEGVNSEQKSKELQEAVSAYQASLRQLETRLLGPQEKKQLVKETAIKLETLVSRFIQINKLFTLEEMTIETLLAEKFDQNKFDYVLGKQKINGSGYIISSANKAKANLSLMLTLFATFKNDYSSDLDSTDQLRFSPLQAEIATLQQKIRPLEQRARNHLISEGIQINFIARKGHANLVNSQEPSCGHGQIPEAMINQIENLIH